MSMEFSKTARQAFMFLEKAGFKLAQHGSTRLLYESSQSIVVVEWDTRSGEIEVFIGLRSAKVEKQETFSLCDILNMQSLDVPERKRPFQVADENLLVSFLEKLAEDTRAYAQPALTGDRMFFRRLETFRSVQSQAYMRDMELRRVRSEADKAWKRKDFDKMVNLYTSIESDLSESEKGKLEYARRNQRQR
jgi:hypothetical protein